MLGDVKKITNKPKMIEKSHRILQIQISFVIMNPSIIMKLDESLLVMNIAFSKIIMPFNLSRCLFMYFFLSFYLLFCYNN